MDWANERYVRVYTRDTSSWIELEWEAQALLMLLMRKVDRSGVYEVGRHGFRGLAAILRMPEDVVLRAMPVLIEDGCVEQHGSSLVLPNFIEAQEASMSPAARQKESRERRRDEIRRGLDPDQRSTVIYFIQSENGGPIKIGYAEDVAKRLLQLQTSRPDKLVLLAAVPGTVGLEHRLHAVCSEIRERGEWFSATSGLLDLVKECSSSGADMETVLETSDWSRIVTCHEMRPVTAVTGHKTRLVTPSVPALPAEPAKPERESGKPLPLPLPLAADPEPVPSADPVPKPSRVPKADLVSAASEQAVAELNRLTGSRFQPDTKATQDDVKILLERKHTVEEMLAVVRAKAREWRSDPDHAKYLRPSTLLRPKNFARYVADLNGTTPPLLSSIADEVSFFPDRSRGPS